MKYSKVPFCLGERNQSQSKQNGMISGNKIKQKKREIRKKEERRKKKEKNKKERRRKWYEIFKGAVLPWGEELVIEQAEWNDIRYFIYYFI